MRLVNDADVLKFPDLGSDAIVTFVFFEVACFRLAASSCLVEQKV